MRSTRHVVRVPRTRILWAATAILGATGVVAPLAAQQGVSAPAALDRTVVPSAGPPPVLHVPAWTEMRLSNGALLVVSESHTLPLLSVTINFEGGADQFEPAGQHGVAELTAEALSEGTTTRTGDQLSNAVQRLGTRISSSIGAEQGSLGVVVLTQNLLPALNLLADELLHPTFPANAIERWKAQRIVALKEARAQTGFLARNAFVHVVYGPAHPYGWVASDSVLAGLTRADVSAFHRAYYRPAHAIITVVGDVTPAAAKRAIEGALADWSPEGSPVSYQYPAVPVAPATTIYLVDKPGAAQSSFAIGLAGPPRSTPDYDALEVMNTILGTLFQSRLNHNIREEKGWSYGVSSHFAYGKGPGAFNAGGAVVTAKTDSALIEFLKELRGVQGGRPFTDDEVAQGKASLIQSLPERFASVDATGQSISGVYLDDLPHDYYQRFAERIRNVTPADLVRVATKYIDLAHLAIVVAGDRATIEAPLRALNVAPVVILDARYDPEPE